MGVVDIVSAIGRFRLVAGADCFIAFRILVPRYSILAGGSVGGASGGPAGGDIRSRWSKGGVDGEF